MTTSNLLTLAAGKRIFLGALVVAILMAAFACDARAESDRQRARRLRKEARQATAQPAPASVSEAGNRSTGGASEVYHVNAQYRGAVTKGIDNLGDLTVTYTPKSDDAFSIKLDAVMHPSKKKAETRFSAAMTYRLRGNVVEPITQDSHFSPEAEKHREKILQNAPFIYLVRYLAFPPSEQQDVTYSVGSLSYRLHYARARGKMEATLFDGQRWIGKFFLLAAPGDRPPYDYEKFRVSTKHDTVISFVRDRGGR